jgi:AraC-like DNA-binding protein
MSMNDILYIEQFEHRSMKMWYYLFPIISKEKELPIYLVSIGKNLYQYHVDRKNGYPQPQILYCTQGEGILKTEGKTYRIHPNDAFFLPANTAHEYYSVGQIWDTRWIIADGYALESMFECMNMKHAAVFHINNTSLLDSILDRMRSAIMSDDIFGNYTASGILYEFITTFHRLTNEAFTNPNIDSANKLKPVISYIRSHYNKNITMNDLCNIISLSPQHVCRLFKKHLNTRPMEYVCMIRIQVAKQSLTNTSLPIYTIALNCGFENTNYFHKMFKRYEKTTPARFRYLYRVMANHHFD